jgi:hypothetical protein
VKVKVACFLPEGQVCTGTIWISGVSHRPGGGKVARFSTVGEISLLGGETREVAVRLLSEIWKSVAGGREQEARILFANGAGPAATKFVQLVPAVRHAGATRPTCGPAHARTTLRSNGVRIYSQAGGAIFGCIESSGVIQKLSPIRPGNRPPYFLEKPFAANAPWVVGVSRHNPRPSFAVTARNLALGDVTPTCRLLGGDWRTYPTVVDQIVITRNGYFAWGGTEEIGSLSGPVNDLAVTVCIGGESETLDRGPGVQVESLVLHGRTLEWEDAGARCTAILKKPIHTIAASVSGCQPL